jgi:predicted amidohydrolase
MRAACFQFDVGVDVDANSREVERGLRDAARAGCALVVLPEMWPTSFPQGDFDVDRALDATTRALDRVRELSRELGLVVCGSAFGSIEGGSLPTNRWHLFDRGCSLASYDKIHLFTPTAEDESFSSGNAAPSASSIADGRARLGGIVCYDLRFPEVARALFHANVDVIAVSAQWPAARASHWRALAIGRAVESQSFVVACNRTGTARIGRRQMELVFPGNSLIVDPDGRVLAEGRGEDGLVIADLALDVARTLRVRVPIAKDERGALYRAWSREP